MRSPWWLVEFALEMLEPEEREVLRGDISEGFGTCSDALGDVFGLVIRRQAELWLEWRPWICLAGITLPFGILLSAVSHWICTGNAISIWLTANNWDRYLLHNDGFWNGVHDSMPGVLLRWLAVCCWSWTSGFAAGALSKRAVWSTGAVFCGVLLACAISDVLSGLGYEPIRQAEGFRGNDAVFDIGFYRWMMPLAAQIGLVALPALRGMWDGAKLALVPLGLKITVWLSVLVTVASLITQGMFRWQVRVWTMGPLRHSHLPSLLLPFAVVGPMAYLLSLSEERKSIRRV